MDSPAQQQTIGTPGNPHPVHRIRRAGDRALLIELDSADRVRQLHAELSDPPVDGITDLVPGATCGARILGSAV